MFSKELQQLIEASLFDGVLTDQERAVIRKRALLDGVDPDEVDVLLEAELQRIRQKQEETVAKVKKCPHCGEIIPALTGVCPSCGYVINTQSQDNKELMDLVNEMEKELEDLKSGSTDNPDEQIAAIDTYRRKARMLYGDNKKVQYLLAEIEAELERYKEKQAKKRKYFYIKLIAAIVAVVLFIIGFMYSCNKKAEDKQADIDQCIRQGQEQCDSLCALIDRLPAPNTDNYKEVEHQLLSIAWKNINCPSSEVDKKVNGSDIDNIISSPKGIIAPYIKKKRAYADQIYAIYKELYPGKNYNASWDHLEASLHAPEEIYNSAEINN